MRANIPSGRIEEVVDAENRTEAKGARFVVKRMMELLPQLSYDQIRGLRKNSNYKKLLLDTKKGQELEDRSTSIPEMDTPSLDKVKDQLEIVNGETAGTSPNHPIHHRQNHGRIDN